MSQLKNKTSLKGYQSQLEKLKGEREVLLFKLRGVEQELRENNRKQDVINKKVERMSKGKLSMSEHAVLRYIERVEVIPPADVPERVLTEKLKEMVRVLGDGEYPCGDYRVKVRGNTVVTIISNRNETKSDKKNKQKERRDFEEREGIDDEGALDVQGNLEDGGQEMCGDWPGIEGRAFDIVFSSYPSEE